MIAKQKKAHTPGENLILSAAKVMVCCVFEDESVKKLNSIFLSNNTIQRRIEEMSVDNLLQVISDICRSESEFAIQLDESTDVTICALHRFDCTNVTKSEFFFRATWFKMGKSKGLQNGWSPSYVRTKVWF